MHVHVSGDMSKRGGILANPVLVFLEDIVDRSNDCKAYDGNNDTERVPEFHGSSLREQF